MPESTNTIINSSVKKIKLSALCELCHGRKAVMKRPKNLMKLCKECFYNIFETEIHNTIISNNLFYRGEKLLLEHQEVKILQY